MNTEIYTTSPGQAVPPSPYQFAINRKDEEIRKLRLELQTCAMNLADLECDFKDKDNELAKKEKLINQLKHEKTSLEMSYEQEIDSLKSFQEKCRIQDREIKRLQQNTEELDNQKKLIEKLENEKEILIIDKENFFEKINALKDDLIKNQGLENEIHNQKLKMEELQSIINKKDEVIEDYCNMKEMYKQQIQQFQLENRKNLELLEDEQLKLILPDVTGEVLSVVCIEKQVAELKAELDEVRESKENEIVKLQHDSDEEIKKMQLKFDEIEFKRKFEVAKLDRLIEFNVKTTENLFIQMNQCGSAVSELESKSMSLKTTCLDRIAHLELENNVKTEQIKLNEKEIAKWKIEARTFSEVKEQDEIKIAKLQSEIVAKSEEIEEKDAFMEKIRNHIESIEKQHKKDRVEIENNIEQVENLFCIMEAQLKKDDEVQVELNNKIDELNEELQTERETGSRLAQELDINTKKSENKLKLLEENLQQMKHKELQSVEIIRNLKEKLKVKDCEYNNLQKEFEQCKNIQTEAIKQLVREKEIFLNWKENILSEIDILQENKCELENDLIKKDNLLMEFEKLSNERASLMEGFSVLEQLKHQLPMLEDGVMRAEERVYQLTTEIKWMQDEINGKEKIIVKMKDKLDELEDEKVVLMNEKKSSEKEIDEWAFKLTEIELSKYQLEEENIDLKIINSNYEENIKSLILKSDKVEVLEDKIIEQGQVVWKMKNELNELKYEKAMAISALAKEKESIEKEIDEWAFKLTEIELRKSQLEEENRILKRSNSECEEKVKILILKSNKMKDQLNEQEQVILKLKTELNELSDGKTMEIAVLVNEKESLEKKITDHELKLAEIEAKKIELEQENCALKINCNEHEDKEKLLTLNSNELKTKMEELEKELSDLKQGKDEVISALENEKESLQKEINNHEMKLIDIESIKNQLEEENRNLKKSCSDYETKMASHQLESNKLRSEYHELGFNHEVELTKKLDFFREMWETEKSALNLELDSRQQESESFKVTLQERLKQEEMKCKLLRQNVMTLQEEVEQTQLQLQEKLKLSDTNLELLEKVELYKHHYEDQKEKVLKLTDVMIEEKKNFSSLMAKVTDLERKNNFLENQVTELKSKQNMNVLPSPIANRNRSVFSKCNSDQLHSTAIEYDKKPQSNDFLDDSLNEKPEEFSYHTKMSAFQSGDHKMETNNIKQQIKFYVGDDEEEDWDLKYVKALKEGDCDVPIGGRLTELQKRNTLCLPHLKTTYPVETQMCSEIPFEEDDFKKGKAILEEFKVKNPSLNRVRQTSTHDNFKVPDSNTLFNHASPKRKVKATEPVYRKPGPPTPAKQLTLALSKSIVKTPSSLKRLFGSRRVFKPNTRQPPVAFNVGFSPIKSKSKRQLLLSPKDERKK